MKGALFTGKAWDEMKKLIAQNPNGVQVGQEEGGDGTDPTEAPEAERPQDIEAEAQEVPEEFSGEVEDDYPIEEVTDPREDDFFLVE